MIYVGPFTGEIGYELLYWIPNVLHRFKDREVTAISRGGTASWYPCPVLNAYDVMEPEEFKRRYLDRKRTTGEFKQLWPDDKLDAEILKRFGIDKTAYHPSDMYGRFGYMINRPLEFHRMTNVEPWPGLPDKYLAARFYKNDYLANSRIVLESDEHPIVALVPRNQIDNHEEIPVEGAAFTVEYDAHNSLEVITRVVAHACGFLCTYGGVGYIGPLCGVKTRVYAGAEHYSKHRPTEDRLGALLEREITK